MLFDQENIAMVLLFRRLLCERVSDSDCAADAQNSGTKIRLEIRSVGPAGQENY